MVKLTKKQIADVTGFQASLPPPLVIEVLVRKRSCQKVGRETASAYVTGSARHPAPGYAFNRKFAAIF